MLTLGNYSAISLFFGTKPPPAHTISVLRPSFPFEMYTHGVEGRKQDGDTTVHTFCYLVNFRHMLHSCRDHPLNVLWLQLGWR